jgi:hypothetical protein
MYVCTSVWLETRARARAYRATVENGKDHPNLRLQNGLQQPPGDLRLRLWRVLLGRNRIRSHGHSQNAHLGRQRL